jgi:two-component system OmpR family sensor kinase
VAMSEQARRIGAASLHGRLPAGNPHDELGRLAAAFNDLLARLDEAFAQQRRFVADASHELRTPVAVLSGEAELALAREDRPTPALRDAIAVMRDEAHRMRRIVDDLFLLARADAGDRALALEELYLADVAADVCRAAQSLARAKEVTLTLAPADDVGPFADALPFRGDEGLLRRLLLNLVDNAIKHTPAGGAVTLAARREGDVYRLTVRDSGPGIPPGEWERVFERFYRAADAPRAGRARRGSVGDSSSAGLGLPIARWIAEAHGGVLRVAASGADGTTFEAVLPSEPERGAG